jgi:NCS1 family nucleobase:cation symporter-1
VLSVLPVVPGFLKAATTPGGQIASPNIFDRLYTYAWFVTFALSFVFYLILMRGSARVSAASPAWNQPITES